MKIFIFTTIVLVVFVHSANSQTFATFSGDTVKIWDMNFNWPCAAMFTSLIKMSQDTIYITESDTNTGIRPNCVCQYALCTSFVGLPAGTYYAVLTRYWKESGNSENAGAVSFTVLKPPAAIPAMIFYQSGCLSYPLSVSDEPIVPARFSMLANYPNPFNPGTVIRYTIPNRCFVLLTIITLNGQCIATLVDGEKDAGSYEVKYLARNLSSGTYICRLSYGKKILSHRIIFLK
jgi:hypothetical protein